MTRKPDRLTGTDMLKGLLKKLPGKGIDLYLVELHVLVLEQARQTGLLEFIGEDHVFPTVDLAVRSIETAA